MALSKSPCRLPGKTAAVIRQGVLGIESDRLLEIGHGLVEIALVVPGIAPGDMNQGLPGIELDRLVVIGDGLVEVLLRLPGLAAAAK